ncbi:MAG: hypothetical protein NT085_01735 [candidate division SR1 bacterium]|nr:hypothetical protein [candidate division SR1 bacterium]
MGVEKAADVDLKKDTKIVGTSFDVSSVQKQSKIIENASTKEADAAKTKMEEQYSFLKSNETMSENKIDIMFKKVKEVTNDISAGKIAIEENHQDTPFYSYIQPNKDKNLPLHIRAHIKNTPDSDIIGDDTHTWTPEDTTYMNNLYKQWKSVGTIVKQSPLEIRESLKKSKEKFMSDKVQWLINDIKSGKQDIESEYRKAPFYFSTKEKSIMAHIKNTFDYDFMKDESSDVSIGLNNIKQQKYTWTEQDVTYMNNEYWQKRAKQM